MKKKGLNPNNVEWFIDAIETGAVNVPELQGQYQSLQNKVWRIEHRKQELERDCQAIQRETVELTQTHNMLFEGFWKQAEIYEQLRESKIQLNNTRNELDEMKKYVNEALKEVHNKRR